MSPSWFARRSALARDEVFCQKPHRTPARSCGETGHVLGRLLAGLALLLCTVVAQAADMPVLRVAYAGSMGVLLDRDVGPAFARAHGVEYQGMGQGSYALARLIAGRQLQADVFVAITPGPVKVLQQAGLAGFAVPVASTRMVVIYSPKSRFAADFKAAAAGRKAWYEVLRAPGLRFGRTDPAIDPQGANALLALQLAARYYRQPGLVKQVAGDWQNPPQLFAETSLMSRLEAGQIDATIGYASAAFSHQLPIVDLPAEIDLAQPALQATWYAKAGFTLASGKRIEAQPLVFYASVPKDAQQPELGRAFVDFLQDKQGRALLRERGYDPPRGDAL